MIKDDFLKKKKKVQVSKFLIHSPASLFIGPPHPRPRHQGVGPDVLVSIQKE